MGASQCHGRPHPLPDLHMQFHDSMQFTQLSAHRPRALLKCKTVSMDTKSSKEGWRETVTAAALSALKVSLREVQGPRAGVWWVEGGRKPTLPQGALLHHPRGELALGEFRRAAPRGRVSAGLGPQVALRCEDRRGCPGTVCSDLKPRCQLSW